jgi:hypothetical protein
LTTMDNDRHVELSDEDIDLVKELAEARSQSNMWKKRADELRDTLMSTLSQTEATSAITAGGTPVIHVQRISTTRVNRKKLEAKYPDVFNDVAEASETRKLEIDIPVEILGVRSSM